jgi:hypothetical protein
MSRDAALDRLRKHASARARDGTSSRRGDARMAHFKGETRLEGVLARAVL